MRYQLIPVKTWNVKQYVIKNTDRDYFKEIIKEKS